MRAASRGPALWAARNFPTSSTYLYLAILVAHAQGVASVEFQLDPKFGLVGTDGLSPSLFPLAPTLRNAVHEFEKVLWEAIRTDKTESYDAKCDCTPIECQEHRMLGDLEGKCNQNCRRFRLYAELEGRSTSGHRLFAAVDAPPDDWPAWSEIAASISSVSLLRFGSVGVAQRPPDEDKVHYALKTFFEKADGKQGKRATR